MADPEYDRRLRELVALPREELTIELKGWLDVSSEADRANIAQAILALANSGGGYILVGFSEVEGHWAPAPGAPLKLDAYSQDAINQIVQRYADPPFQCALHHVPDPAGLQCYPIIVVPGNHRVPIRAKSDDPARKHVRLNRYYIRRPGPSSDEPRSAHEWDDLIRRCMLAARDDLLMAFRQIMDASATAPTQNEAETLREWERVCRQRWQHLVKTALANEQPSRYEHGVWSVSYSLIGSPKKPDLPQFLSILAQVSGHETGWPPWWVPTRDEIMPYSFEGYIECWMKETRFDKAAHSDFWRAAPDPKLYLLRGYHEDAVKQFEPGAALVVSSPIWTMSEVLLHASRLASTLAPSSLELNVRCQWDGLSDRTLATWHRDFNWPVRRCRQSTVTSELSCTTDQIADILPELVLRLTKPLYQAFDFYTPALQFVQQEVAELRKSGR